MKEIISIILSEGSCICRSMLSSPLSPGSGKDSFRKGEKGGGGKLGEEIRREENIYLDFYLISLIF